MNNFDFRIIEPFSASSAVWNKLVPISVVITIEENVQRVQSSLEECASIGLFPYVIVSKKNKKDTIQGCWRSHQIAAEFALMKQKDRVLILEDDVVINSQLNSAEMEKILENVAGHLNESVPHDTWTMCMLGYIAMSPMFRVHDNVARGNKFRYTHAYILSRSGMRKLVTEEYKGEHVDKYLGDSVMNEINLAVYPQIVLQKDIPSTNNSFILYTCATSMRNAIGYKRLTEIMNFFMLKLGGIMKK